jgi:hypothetical protein
MWAADAFSVADQSLIVGRRGVASLVEKRDLAVIDAKNRIIFFKHNAIVSLSSEVATLRRPFIFL